MVVPFVSYKQLYNIENDEDKLTSKNKQEVDSEDPQENYEVVDEARGKAINSIDEEILAQEDYEAIPIEQTSINEEQYTYMDATAKEVSQTEELYEYIADN